MGSLQYLFRVGSYQSDHGINSMLSLELLLPLWVSVLQHISQPVSPKVVAESLGGPHQGTSSTLEHWNL